VAQKYNVALDKMQFLDTVRFLPCDARRSSTVLLL